MNKLNIYLHHEYWFVIQFRNPKFLNSDIFIEATQVWKSKYLSHGTEKLPPDNSPRTIAPLDNWPTPG